MFIYLTCRNINIVINIVNIYNFIIKYANVYIESSCIKMHLEDKIKLLGKNILIQVNFYENIDLVSTDIR